LPERGKLDYARNAEEGLVGGEEFNDFLKSWRRSDMMELDAKLCGGIMWFNT
jgi:hypothetical protein